jgi:hypothetical protein
MLVTVWSLRGVLPLVTAKPLVVEAGTTPASAARGFFMLLYRTAGIIRRHRIAGLFPGLWVRLSRAAQLQAQPSGRADALQRIEVHLERGRGRASGRQPVLFVDHDHVDRGVIGLHLLKEPGDLGRCPACGPAGPRRVPASLAVTVFTGSSMAIRRSTAPRDGTRSPRTLHSRVISRYTEVAVRRCRVRYRVRRTSRTTASTSSGSRPPPRPTST